MLKISVVAFYMSVVLFLLQTKVIVLQPIMQLDMCMVECRYPVLVQASNRVIRRVTSERKHEPLAGVDHHRLQALDIDNRSFILPLLIIVFIIRTTASPECR